MQEEDNLDSLLKTFVKGSFILFLGVIISKIATYLYKVIVARNFSPEIYGLFSLAIMIATFVATILHMGLSTGLLRYIPFYRGKGETEKIQSIIRFSMNVVLIVSFIGGILLFFFSESISINIFHNSQLTIFLQWFSIFIPLFVFSGFFHGIILAYEKVGWYSFIGNILAPLMQVISLVVFIFFIGLNIESIVFSYNFGFLVTFLAAFFVSKYAIKEIFKKPNIEKKEKYKLNKELFSYSWPIMFLGVVTYLFAFIDSFTIGYFKNATDVGIYNVAVPLSYLLLIAPGLFLQPFLPVITKEYSKGNFNLIKDLSKQIGKWIFIFNIPILIILILFPGAVINLLFGSAYIQAENSLRFLAIGFFFYSIFLISENLLSMIGKSKITLFNLLISSIVNISLNIILIPKYGISGAAFSTMLSYVLWGILSFFIAKHHTSATPLKWDMIKIILVAIIPTAILFYIRSIISVTVLNMIIVGILFVAVYFALIILTRSLDKNDLMILRAIKKKIIIKR